MTGNDKERRKKIGLKGIFKIGSREWRTIAGNPIYCVSPPELAAIKIRCLLTALARAAGFYAAKCGRGDGHSEWPLKFRLNRCKDCRRERPPCRQRGK